jgi:hypothetical protein
MEKGLPTYDLECINWTIPIAVGFYDGYNYHEFLKETEDDDVIWRFLCFLRENFKGIKLYAHCGSKFDAKFILNSLTRHGEVVDLRMGLIRLKWEKPNITFEDSYLLLPMKLSNINRLFGVEEKKDWKHEDTVEPWKMQGELATFRSYLRTDCISLSHSIYKLCELLGTTFGIMPSISLSTTATKAFSRCFFDVENIKSNEKFEPYIREAMYGGRNEVYERYGEGIFHYDIKSMFVSCYNIPVPVGQMRWVRPDSKEGTIAEATVKVPKDWYIGPLPYRLKEEGLPTWGRLIFPVGEFTGWWDMYELERAADMGVDFTIRRKIFCEEEPILQEFGKFMGGLRGNSHDEFWKLFGLAPSGKFGQNRWRDVIRHHTRIQNFKGYFPIDKEELYFSTKEYIKGDMPYIKPAVSMRVRSAARVKHLQIILEALQKGKVFYGDTDSVFTTVELPTGSKIGDLSLVGVMEKGYFIRQKLYALKEKGRLRQVSAGYRDLKLTEEEFNSLLEGDTVEVDSPTLPSLRGILKDKELNLLDKTRPLKFSAFYDNRIPEGVSTRPIILPTGP